MDRGLLEDFEHRGRSAFALDVHVQARAEALEQVLRREDAHALVRLHAQLLQLLLQLHKVPPDLVARGVANRQPSKMQ